MYFFISFHCFLYCGCLEWYEEDFLLGLLGQLGRGGEKKFRLESAPLATHTPLQLPLPPASLPLTLPLYNVFFISTIISSIAVCYSVKMVVNSSVNTFIIMDIQVRKKREKTAGLFQSQSHKALRWPVYLPVFFTIQRGHIRLND